MNTENDPQIKNDYLIFGLIMVILAACFTLLTGIKPKGDSSDFPGKAYAFSRFITGQLKRVFPQHYGLLKKGQYWIGKFSAWLGIVLPNQTDQDSYNRRQSDKGDIK